MGEHSAILRNINEQLAGLTNEISNLQRRLDTTETYISNMSNTQASLIHQMAAKPEAATSPENKPAETFEAMSTCVTTIRVFEEVKTNGIGEVMALGRKSPKNLEIENLSSEKIVESGLDDNLSLVEIFPLYLRMIN